MVEIWKDIKGYEASNFGRVRSLDRYEVVGKAKRFRKGRILKPSKKKNGYLYVILYKEGRAKTFSVHRLVWEAFNGEIPDGYEINHIDENPLNNRLSNLNLLTHCQNMNWGTRTQRCVEKLSDPVLQLTLDDVLVKEWPSISEAGRNGFSQGLVSLCCNGKCKSYKGFKWVKKISVYGNT